MNAIQKHLLRKLKASTLVEVIVAMVIILTSATAGFTILAKQSKGINNTLRIEAEMNLAFVVNNAKKNDLLLDNSFPFDNMRVELHIENYRNNKNLRVLICEAYTLHNEFICGSKEIISIKGVK